MRSLRSFVVLLCLCLILAASGASATEGSPRTARRESGTIARIVHDLQAILKVVWENEGAEIDPLGGKSQGNGNPVQEDPASPGTNEGFEIDPWG